MKTLLILLLLSLSLSSQTLEETYQNALQHNYQLQILEEELAIVIQQEKIESLWDDPVLSVGINDIQFEKPLSRDLEAMQNQYVALSQSIPLSNRLELSAQIEEEKQRLIKEKQEALKVEISTKLRKAFIEVEYAQKRLEILDGYIAFLKTPMQLLRELSAIEKGTVEKYIKTELLQKKYQLQRQNALEAIEVAKENVELISNRPVDTFEGFVGSNAYENQTLEGLLTQVQNNNPKLSMSEILNEVALKGVALAKAKEQADIKVTAGYYQRLDRNDFISLGVAYPLYTNGKQEKQRVQAMKRVNIQALTVKETELRLAQALKIALHELKRLKQESEILNQSRNKIEALIRNARLNLSTGGSLVKYYELFSQKVENALVLNQKQRIIALTENRIQEILGEKL
ncbi:MAG TPA: TolC family protein [Campylobacterales bacterium]|nr:TolC family protein [Campylobacterales bacterium]